MDHLRLVTILYLGGLVQDLRYVSCIFAEATLSYNSFEWEVVAQL